MKTNNKKVRDLIKEEIEKDRKQRHKIYIYSFLVGVFGALIFFLSALISYGQNFSFISGVEAGFIDAFGIWIMYFFIKSPWEDEQGESE